jgi:outer membrane receptor for ferric coprogen and ferric-rhodotorulic acid
LLPQNQINKISYAKSQAHKILQAKKTHTHTQKRHIHTIQTKKNKNKSFSFPPTQPNKIFAHRREDQFKATTLQTRLLVLQQLPLFPKGKLKQAQQQQKKNKLLLERIYSQDRMGRGKGGK